MKAITTILAVSLWVAGACLCLDGYKSGAALIFMPVLMLTPNGYRK